MFHPAIERRGPVLKKKSCGCTYCFIIQLAHEAFIPNIASHLRDIFLESNTVGEMAEVLV
jgi:hypothetical protein